MVAPRGKDTNDDEGLCQCMSVGPRGALAGPGLVTLPMKMYMALTIRATSTPGSHSAAAITSQ